MHVFTWVLRELCDVRTVVEFGKMNGNHLSMMLSHVSRDPELREEQALRALIGLHIAP